MPTSRPMNSNTTSACSQLINRGSRSSRAVRASPACGPEPVTTVPITTMTAVTAISALPSNRVVGRVMATPGGSTGSVANWTSATQAATTTSDCVPSAGSMADPLAGALSGLDDPEVLFLAR